MIILRIILIAASVALGEIIIASFIAAGMKPLEIPDWLAWMTSISVFVFIMGLVAGLIAMIVRFV